MDPVDPAIMRRPPRKKDAPIITQRLLARVLFSASIIVLGTLFVYVFALEDDNVSRREQTMVSLRQFYRFGRLERRIYRGATAPLCGWCLGGPPAIIRVIPVAMPTWSMFICAIYDAD